jgi:hypothetical protein
MAGKVDPKLLIAGAALIMALALIFLIRQVTAPRETIRDPLKNPPAELQNQGGVPGGGNRM